MKKLYWRSRGISPAALVVIAILSLAGMLAVELIHTRKQQPRYSEKLHAAELALDAMEIIKQERTKRDLLTDPNVDVAELDPAQSGLIGKLTTPITSANASLQAKQLSVNPNFAAAVVDMLRKAGVRQGDVVAVGCTGSFPALNICVYAAMKAMNLRPIIITSEASSQYGANDPEFTWLDMERALYDHYPEKFPFRSVAASLGGVNDRASDLSDLGKGLLLKAIERNIEKNELAPGQIRKAADSIRKRMSIYNRQAAGSVIKAYINVGGGTVSTGTRLGKRAFQPGLTLRKAPGVKYPESVMTHFIEQGVPVLHLMQVEDLAKQYGLPTEPPKTIPRTGEGGVFYRDEYNRWLAAAVLLMIVLCLYAFVRSEVGYRILQIRARGSGDLFHEPMV